ncbi:hypothetical protein XELAEV_18013159mg [Xenopus laevis]|uniref:Uncharacterized protein n=1 Tax=Xenopus laevis TaxID=8355 RepID=A0A974HZD6_XENLA|nr:hypothetical protein XELAEV_18013159mg [Xenopus laevis]
MVKGFVLGPLFLYCHRQVTKCHLAPKRKRLWAALVPVRTNERRVPFSSPRVACSVHLQRGVRWREREREDCSTRFKSPSFFRTMEEPAMRSPYYYKQQSHAAAQSVHLHSAHTQQPLRIHTTNKPVLKNKPLTKGNPPSFTPLTNSSSNSPLPRPISAEPPRTTNRQRSRVGVGNARGIMKINYNWESGANDA